MFLLLLVLSSLVTVLAMPSVTIGGMFSVLDSGNNLINSDQVQHLAAFLMAVNEINNKSDGICDELLPNTTIKFIVQSNCNSLTSTALSSANLVEAQIDSVVSTLSNPESLLSLGLFTENKIVEAIAVASDTSMGFGWLYPYRVGIAPLDSLEALKLQYLLCKYFSVTEVTIFATNNAFGEMGVDQLLDNSICSISAVSIQFLSGAPINLDYTSYITSALTDNTQYFVMLTDAVTGGLLLEQGYNRGLFRPGTQIIGSQTMLTPTLWQSMSLNADVVSILKGFVAVQYWPDYSVLNTQVGQEFVQRWRAQSSTLGVGTCDNRSDDSSSHTPLFSLFDGTLCIGLNYSSFATDGSNLAPTISNTYDAVYLLAYGMHSVLYDSNASLTADTLDYALLHNVSFTGASGLVHQSPGTSSLWNKGTRPDGIHWKIMNFNPTQYLQNSSSEDVFAYTAEFTVAGGVVMCSNSPGLNCEQLIYNNPLNESEMIVPLADNGWEPPSVIKIGLLIESRIDPSTNMWHVQSSEHLAAVQMAIREINDKNDGVLDDLLPNTVIKLVVARSKFLSSSGTDAATLLSTAFGGTGVQAIIAAVPYLPAISTFNQKSVVNILTMATDSSLSIGSQFPYKVETLPVDNFDQVAWQDIFCNYFHYSKISLFISSDITMADNVYCDITLLSSHSFEPGTIDFSVHIASAKVAGARIFAMYMTDVAMAGRLLEQGHAAGLFGLDTFVVGSADMASPVLWQSMSAGADVSAILQGFTVVQYWPKYTVDTQQSAAMAFVNRWREQQNTVKHNGNTTTCNHTQDDNLGFFLYHQPLAENVLLQDARCTGLEFSNYAANGSDLHHYTAYSYDAVHLLAYGLARFSSNPTPAALVNTIINHVSLAGVTGTFALNRGDGGISNIRKGDREVDVHYKILSFNEYMFALNSSSSDFMTYVGQWSRQHGTQMCFDITFSSLPCSTIQFKTLTGAAPGDQLPPVTLQMTMGGRALLWTLAVVLIVGTVSLMAFIVIKRKTKLVKVSQPGMALIMLVGGLFSAGKIIVAALPISASSCTAGLWMGHLAFCFGVCTLFMKSWRIDKIINTRTIKRVVVTEYGIIMRTLAISSIMIMYLIILTIVGQPRLTHTTSVTENQATFHLKCGLHKASIHTILFFLESICLLVGVRLCWATRNAPDVVNESKFIAQSIAFLAIISCLVLPIVFLLPITPATGQIIASLAFFAVTIVVFGLMFGPKVHATFIEIKDAPISPSRFSASAKSNGDEDEWEEKLLKLAKKAMKNKLREDRPLLCQQQIVLWQSMLLEINDKNSSSSGSNPSAGRKQSVSLHSRSSHSHSIQVSQHEHSSHAIPDENSTHYSQNSLRMVDQWVSPDELAEIERKNVQKLLEN